MEYKKYGVFNHLCTEETTLVKLQISHFLSVAATTYHLKTLERFLFIPFALPLFTCSEFISFDPSLLTIQACVKSMLMS